jgi:hypothetical protein
MSAYTDGEILRLFQQWIAEHRAAERIPKENEYTDEFDAAVHHIGEIEHAIADIPASGPVGFAVKAYLACHHEHGPSHRDDPAGVSLLSRGFVCDPDRPLDSNTNFHCIAAVIRDAARFVPEIAELARLVIDPPPDMVAAETARVYWSILSTSGDVSNRETMH